MALIFPIYRFVVLDKDINVVNIQEIKELRKWFVAFSLLMSILLIISNLALLIYLSKKEEVMSMKLGDDSGVFSTEKRRLVLISTIFILSYIIDYFYCQFAINYIEDKE